MLKFSFKTSLLTNLFTDLIHLWFDENFAHVSSCQGHSHVKIFILKFYANVLRTSLVLNQIMDLIYIWYHNIYWSKVFISTISTYEGDLGVEVLDLEF